MKTIGIIQPNYIPWRGYFDFMKEVDRRVRQKAAPPPPRTYYTFEFDDEPSLPPADGGLSNGAPPAPTSTVFTYDELQDTEAIRLTRPSTGIPTRATFTVTIPL